MGTDMLVIKSLQLGVLLLLLTKDPVSIIRIIKEKVDPHCTNIFINYTIVRRTLILFIQTFLGGDGTA